MKLTEKHFKSQTFSIYTLMVFHSFFILFHFAHSIYSLFSFYFFLSPDSADVLIQYYRQNDRTYCLLYVIIFISFNYLKNPININIVKVIPFDVLYDNTISLVNLDYQ